MTHTSTFISLAAIQLDESSSVSLYRQLYEILRGAILSARLVPGTRLPSSRELAKALKVSRNTVVVAYEQLTLEGFVKGRTGAGTFVTPSLPTSSLKDRTEGFRSDDGQSSRNPGNRISGRGRKIMGLWGAIGRDHYHSNAFRPRLPASDVFPLEVWSRLTSRRWRNMPSDLLTYGDPAGYLPLRQIIASYLKESRDIACDPGQIIIVSGTPQAINLSSAVLLNQGDPVWMEDPGYPRARVTLMLSNAELIPVPIDSEGLDVEAGLALEPYARMVYVTPSHQYPMGNTMSLTRRMRLLEWARSSRAWILEDDYGTEFRSGLPLAALQNADALQCVIYMGTYSNILFPALRLGFVVVPEDVVDAFLAARVLMERCPPLFGQVVLTDFIGENHFERYIRRLREIHERRYNVLIESLQQSFGDSIEIHSDEAGMQLVALLPKGLDDRMLSKEIANHGVEAPPLSFYTINKKGRHGFVLGYSAVREKDIRICVQRMKTALHKYLPAV